MEKWEAEFYDSANEIKYVVEAILPQYSCSIEELKKRRLLEFKHIYKITVTVEEVE